MDPQTLRLERAKCYDVFKIFYEMIFPKGLTVVEILEDPTIRSRLVQITDIFNVIPVKRFGLQKYMPTTILPNHDILLKVALESCCFYEWMVKLFLKFFSSLTPYKRVPIVTIIIEKLSYVLRSLRNDDPSLFAYFIQGISELMIQLSRSCKKSGSKTLIINNFSRYLDALKDLKVKSGEQLIEPDISLDLKLENSSQVEALFICVCEMVIQIGNPFYDEITCKCEKLLFNVLADSVCFGTIQMIEVSLNLFNKLFPFKHINLNVTKKGFIYYLLHVTAYVLHTYDDNLSHVVSDSWFYVLKKIKLLLSKGKSSYYDPCSLLSYIAKVLTQSDISNEAKCSSLLAYTLPQVIQSLCISCFTYDISLPQLVIQQVYDTFWKQLVEQLAYDNNWISLIKAIAIIDYEKYVIVPMEVDGDFSNTSPKSDYSKTLFFHIIDMNSKMIDNFLSKALIDLKSLHNSYAIEWETMMYLKLENINFSLNTNIHKMTNVVEILADSIVIDGVTNEKNSSLEHIFNIFWMIVRASDKKSESLVHSESKIGLCFLLPWVNYQAPESLLRKVNPIWIDNSFKNEIRITSQCLRGLSLLPLAVYPDYSIKTFINVLVDFDCSDKEFESLLSIFLSSTYNSEHWKKVLEVLIIIFKESDISLFKARSLGLLACISSSNTALRSSSKGYFDPCHLEFFCACEKNVNMFQSSDFFHKDLLIDCFLSNLQDTKYFSVLVEMSANRFLSHFHLNDKVLIAIFRLFSHSCSETKKSLHHLLKIIIKYFSEGSQYDFFIETLLISLGSQQSKEEELAKLDNLSFLGSLLSEESILHLLKYYFRKIWFGGNLSTAANESFGKLLKSKGTSKSLFFEKYLEVICLELIDMVLDEVMNEPEKGFSSLQDALSIFIESDELTTNEQVSLDLIFTKSLYVTLPVLVHKADERSKILLENVTANSNLSFKMLFTGYSHSFRTYFVRKLSVPEIKNSFEFLIEMCTDNDFLSGIGHDFRYQLFFDYAQFPDTVSYMLSIIHSFEQNKIRLDLENFDSTKDFKDFLEKHMGGLLIAYNKLLINLNKKLEEKKNAMESLGKILSILGKEKVPTFKMNLMGILLTAFNNARGNEEFCKVLLSVWSNFLKNCESEDIMPHLSVICKDLIPFFEVDVKETVQVFTRLIVLHEKEIKKLAYQLHFLPRIPEMSEVNKVIDKYTLKKTPSNFHEKVDYFKDELRLLEKLLQSNNNPDVKVKHLIKLREILRLNNDAMEYLIMPNKDSSADKAVNKLIRRLFLDSSISNENLQISIAECLGEICAIDPGRLDLISLTENKRDVMFDEIEELPVLILTKLANTLDSISESRFRDCLCYALQEILKCYKIQVGGKIWNELPSLVQVLIKPFFDTKYMLKEVNEKFLPPIFRSDLDFNEWSYQWCLSLIEIVGDEHKNLFERCSAIIKYNSTICQFLMPYIFWIALTTCDENAFENVILKEINTVISSISGDIFLPSQRPLSFQIDNIVSEVSNDNSDQLLHLCAKTIFGLLDSLTLWRTSNTSNSRTSSSQLKMQITRVENFFERLSKCHLAHLAYETQAYARAMLYMEEYIREYPQDLEENLYFLQQNYVSLDEPDGVNGINAIRNKPASLTDIILGHEANGNFHNSLSCCEKAIIQNPFDLNYHIQTIRCLMNLDQFNNAINYASGLITKMKDWKASIYPYMVEATWKLSDWENLDKLLENNAQVQSLAIGIGQMLNCINYRDEDKLEKLFRAVRKKEMEPLSAIPMEIGAYIRGYQHVINLHMINDLETFYRHLKDDKLDVEDLFSLWQSRSENLQSSLRYKEPVYNLHRVLLSVKGLPKEFELQKINLCLKSAKLARKNQNYQRAYVHLLDVQDFINNNKDVPLNLVADYHIEMAKYNWSKGELEAKENSIKVLYRGMEKYFSSNSTDREYARMKLFYVNLCEQLSNRDSNSLIEMYKSVILIRDDWEEGYFCLAKYVDRLLSTLDNTSEERPNCMLRVLKYHGMALKYGSKHVYESMPRLLSVWCDIGSHSESKHEGKGRKSLGTKLNSALSSANSIIKDLKTNLPLYLFYTSFSQLISRICHSNQSISNLMVEIIASLLVQFPQQCMWRILGVLLNKSKTLRTDQCKKIMIVATKTKPCLEKFFTDMQTLAVDLIELCSYMPKEKQAKTFQISAAIPNLKKRITSKDFSMIMLPYQAFMTVQLPPKCESQLEKYSPFPSDMVYISDFVDKAMIFSSQARPKKVEVVCSDGKKYSMIFKPKDDLRKDALTMEYNLLINRLLKRDPETRKRQLKIRTYTVVPLSHNCGLIEWIPNLRSLKETLFKHYIAHRPKYTNVKDTMQAYQIIHKSLNDVDACVKHFTEKILPKYQPPVFGEWFIKTFPDPTAWYMSRLMFARSVAVMSVVGYIIGLGDRHPENILMDWINGEMVHVDFNLLFNNGETLAVPERVPFRLTHNIVDAMGPTGYEGVFRRTCEVTLAVMRQKKEALMSVLRPFVYDPLLEWEEGQQRSVSRSMIKESSKKKESEIVEVTNHLAIENIGKIEDRLNGVIIKNQKLKGLPVSVSGQVAALIEEAVDLRNLSRMFSGWSSFL